MLTYMSDLRTYNEYRLDLYSHLVNGHWTSGQLVSLGTEPEWPLVKIPGYPICINWPTGVSWSLNQTDHWSVNQGQLVSWYPNQIDHWSVYQGQSVSHQGWPLVRTTGSYNSIRRTYDSHHCMITIHDRDRASDMSYQDCKGQHQTWTLMPLPRLVMLRQQVSHSPTLMMLWSRHGLFHKLAMKETCAPWRPNKDVLQDALQHHHGVTSFITDSWMKPEMFMKEIMPTKRPWLSQCMDALWKAHIIADLSTKMHYQYCGSTSINRPTFPTDWAVQF
jgi:hypothetical protein